MTQVPLLIRRSSPEDAPAFVRLFSDEDLFGNTLQLPYPDLESWRKRLADIAVPGTSDISLVGLREGEIVASAGLFRRSPSLRQRHVASVGMSVAREAQGQGVGRQMLAALVDYADNWAQVLRLELTVFADNARAIGLYEKFGFVVEGRHRGDTLRAGRYADSLTMARLHPRRPRWD
jgi:putative acetyltransferase